MSEYQDLLDMGVTFRPISTWPGKQRPDGTREVSNFEAPFATTAAELGRELRLIRAEHVVVELALREVDFRNDGLPKARARASHPGIVVSLESRTVGQPLRYAGDKFYAWQDNLRAIAKTMEAQRMMRRYGTAEHNEQYTGWRALTAGGAMLQSEAVEFVREHAPDVLVDTGHGHRLGPGGAKRLYEATHPDTGGTDELFKQAQQAVAALT